MTGGEVAYQPNKEESSKTLRRGDVWEADAVVAELNSAIDCLEETYTILGGGIENIAVAHSGTRRKSVLRHTLDIGNAATSALKLVARNVADAYKEVI